MSQNTALQQRVQTLQLRSRIYADLAKFLEDRGGFENIMEARTEELFVSNDTAGFIKRNIGLDTKQFIAAQWTIFINPSNDFPRKHIDFIAQSICTELAKVSKETGNVLLPDEAAIKKWANTRADIAMHTLLEFQNYQIATYGVEAGFSISGQLTGVMTDLPVLFTASLPLLDAFTLILNGSNDSGISISEPVPIVLAPMIGEC